MQLEVVLNLRGECTCKSRPKFRHKMHLLVPAYQCDEYTVQAFILRLIWPRAYSWATQKAGIGRSVD